MKTRLAADLDERIAVDLYTRFVRDTLATVKKLEFACRICFHPANRRAAFTQWLGESYRYTPQRGKGLGQRLEYGFSGAFSSGFRRVAAIGTDTPDLPPALIREAFAALASADAVIGPARDGGYYLIGFRRGAYLRSAFTGIEWGTPSVFCQTMETMRKAGTTVHVLPPWQDIDTFNDLKAYMRRNATMDMHHSETYAYIESSGLVPQ